MKHLFLPLLFSASLAAFSQDSIRLPCSGILVSVRKQAPDTLRAIILATMCRRCAAEAIQGYVVIEQGKRPVYLDGRKRALKGFKVGWGYEIVGGKEK